MSTGQVVFPTSETPEITILSVGGDLRLSGWDLSQFRAESGSQTDLTVEQTAEGLRFSCRSDASVSVPRLARVIVQNVRGDVKAKALDGNLELQTVGGALTLRHTGAVSAAQVKGDVDAKRVSGALKLSDVSGSANVRGVTGEVDVEVRGDLDLNQVSRSIRARAGGDIDLRHSVVSGMQYTLEAGGDARLRAEPGVWARFEMQAGGEVLARVREAQVEGNTKYQVVTVGQEEASGGISAQVWARAGSDVSLRWEAAATEMDDLGEDIGKLGDEYAAQIETQVHSHMAELERQLAERLAKVNVPLGLVDVGGADVAARVRQAVERASDKARRKAEAAQRKLDRHAARSRHDWTWGFEPSSRAAPAAPVPPPAEPVSEAERLAILRMLAEGKISVDQAEILLAALEGRA